MADSRVGAAKVKDEPGIFYSARQKGNTQRMMGTCYTVTCDDRGSRECEVWADRSKPVQVLAGGEGQDRLPLENTF